MTSIAGVLRGIVANAEDPSGAGRVQVTLHSAGIDAPMWAEVCGPVGHGAPDAVPALASEVWVAFDGGDANAPVVVGMARPLQRAGSAPAVAGLRRLVETESVSVVLDERPGSAGLTIAVHAPDGPAITIEAGSGGLTLRNGAGASIELIGPMVTINAGALEVV